MSNDLLTAFELSVADRKPASEHVWLDTSLRRRGRGDLSVSILGGNLDGKGMRNGEGVRGASGGSWNLVSRTYSIIVLVSGTCGVGLSFPPLIFMLN
jgi:hypothetical protein